MNPECVINNYEDSTVDRFELFRFHYLAFGPPPWRSDASAIEKKIASPRSSLTRDSVGIARPAISRLGCHPPQGGFEYGLGMVWIM